MKRWIGRKRRRRRRRRRRKKKNEETIPGLIFSGRSKLS
jgi:hypothetical protein